MLAHIAGVPVEELLLTLVATGSGITIALRAAFGRRHQRS
jgi:hypothetical protein